ncbi:MAG: leucine--tRNA ligase [Actinomycetia bacterium]|nr:leucine--tRNA ligase [Actinomycetes bacterium]
MKKYTPKEIEPKWQKVWEDTEIYRVSEEPGKPKRYIMEYFPYPSGAAMHVGHVRNYVIGDAMVRYERMKGMSVLHPMGWDAFGLPAENYAIKTGISPQQAIEENTSKFKQQLTQMGFSYDWSREINSSDPDYYRWTQWFFLLLHKRGLAYRKESLQWWCPHDKTVLANEQVEDGLCWRCDNEVVKKPLKQWFFKITDYADRLDNDLEKLDWSDALKTMQHNWIGKSVGAKVSFKIDKHDESLQVFTTRQDTLFGVTFAVISPEHPLVDDITTDEHKSEVEAYQKESLKKSDIERQKEEKVKTGVFSGAYAINPANNEKIPIWVADYVLMGYGTGIVMGVPAHDQRDYEFASRFDLPIKQVYMESGPDPVNPPQDGYDMVERDTVVVHLKDKSTGKYALLNWRGTLEGITTAIMGGVDEGETPEEAAIKEIAEEAGLDAKVVKTARWISAATYCASHKKENRKSLSTAVYAEVDDLTDQKDVADHEKKTHSLVWVDKDKVEAALIPVNQKQIWGYLNNDTALSGEGEVINSGRYDGMRTSELREKIIADLEKEGSATEEVNYRIRDWLISRQRYWGAPIPIIHCRDCGEVAVPDDQLPVKLPEMDKYEPADDGQSPLARDEDWVHTACPDCGGAAKRETDTMDGFACSSWYFLRFADPHNDNEAFSAEKAKYWSPVDSYIGGAEHAVMHLLYARFWVKVMHDAGLIDWDEPFTQLRNQGMILAPDGQKMSKSKGNVIAPDELIDNGYGADAVRLMELFIGPWDQDAAWSVNGISGTYRFLQRVWGLVQGYLEHKDDKAAADPEKSLMLKSTTHKTIKKVTKDLEGWRFNTAIAACMELVNDLNKLREEHPYSADLDQWGESLAQLVQMLAPFAPHISEELWEDLGYDKSVHVSNWPVWDEELIKDSLLTIVVQVNGKVRANLEVLADAEEAEIVKLAEADSNVQKFTAEGKIVKKIYVKNKLVNFVVE